MKPESGKKPGAVIIPGSFDPVTLGHLDLIRRAAEEYEEVYAVIFKNPAKTCKFPLADRLLMLMLATEEIENVLVSESDGLVIDYMKEHGIGKIYKGYRNEEDLAYEKKMAAWNSAHGGYETVLVPSDPALTGVSSTEARKRLASGESLDRILPPIVIEFLKTR